MSLKRWIILGLAVLVLFAVFASAADDSEDADERPEGSVVEGRGIDEVTEGVDAEDAAEELDDDTDDKDTDTTGIKAMSWFPKYGDLKVPAGERLEIVIPISNAAGNPNYEIALIAGHLTMFDHQRYIQNFSAQVYARAVEPGETATVKYTVTPDAMIEPSEYAFIVAAYLRTDDNMTMMITAFNGTMTVVDPLGFDFKGLFSVVAFFAVVGGAVYFILQKRAENRPAPRRVASAPVETGAAKSNRAYDPEFIDPSHLAYLNAKRNRSASK